MIDNVSLIRINVLEAHGVHVLYMSAVNMCQRLICLYLHTECSPGLTLMKGTINTVKLSRFSHHKCCWISAHIPWFFLFFFLPPHFDVWRMAQPFVWLLRLWKSNKHQQVNSSSLALCCCHICESGVCRGVKKNTSIEDNNKTILYVLLYQILR